MLPMFDELPVLLLDVVLMRFVVVELVFINYILYD